MMQESRYKVSSVVRHRQSPIMWPLPQRVTMARPARQYFVQYVAATTNVGL